MIIFKIFTLKSLHSYLSSNFTDLIECLKHNSKQSYLCTTYTKVSLILL